MTTFIKPTEIPIDGAHTLPREYFTSPDILAQELERMLEVGAFETKIRQREAEIQALRQRKALLESELGRLRRDLSELVEA